MIVDIKDKESLRTWLDAFPGTDREKRQVAVIVAARATALVWPSAWLFFEYYTEARSLDLTATPILGSV